MLASPLSLQEREASADDHEFITLSEKTQCPVYLISEKVQGNLPCFSHTKESRVKTLFLTEKAFHQDIKLFWEKVNLSSCPLKAALNLCIENSSIRIS